MGLVMYAWNTPWKHSRRKWKNEDKKTQKKCMYVRKYEQLTKVMTMIKPTLSQEMVLQDQTAVIFGH